MENLEIKATKEELWDFISDTITPYIKDGNKIPNEVIDDIIEKVKVKFCN